MSNNAHTLGSSAFQRLVRAAARQMETAESRVRTRISFCALAAVFEQGARGGLIISYAVKGGAGMELRFGSRARTTADFDLSLAEEKHRLLDALDAALAPGFGPFTFRRKPKSHPMPNATRITIALDYQGKPWQSIQIDVTKLDDDVSVDLISSDFLTKFGLPVIENIRCLAIPEQIAQKLHAMTAPNPSGGESTRSHDLIDVLLLETLVDDCTEVRRACERIFALRDTHRWPPLAPLPASWAPQLRALALENDFPLLEPDELFHAYSRLLGRILGIDTMPNYQYFFLILEAHAQLSSLATAIDQSDRTHYPAFKRMTETEGWRLSQLLMYPGPDGTRAMLAVLEKEIPG